MKQRHTLAMTTFAPPARPTAGASANDLWLAGAPSLYAQRVPGEVWQQYATPELVPPYTPTVLVGGGVAARTLHLRQFA